MPEHRDIFEQVKEANRIEEVMREAGHELTGGRNRYLKDRQHDSLVVDTHQQAYFWNSRGEQGDVIAFVQRWKRTDAKGAVEYLARRAGIEFEWGGDPEAQRKRLAARVREDALTVAARVFWRRLWKSEAAKTYALGRGWSEETIKAAGLGYSGEGTAEERDELRKAFVAAGVDVESPGAVAVLGYEGNVMKWASKYGLDLDENWVTAKRLPAMPAGMLVYPHVEGGRVKYLSTRAVGEKRHWNLHGLLGGSKQPYYNHVYSPNDKRVVVVEGQADAISLGQWGIPAVAMAGTDRNAGLLERLKERHSEIYIGVDADAAGTKTLHPLGEALGPMARVLAWPEGKDANDWEQAMGSAGMDVEARAAAAEETLKGAQTYVEHVCSLVGKMRGADYQEGLKTATGLINRIRSEVDRASLRARLAKSLGVGGVRELNAMLKAQAKVSQDERRGEDPENITAIVGGFVDGWLIELTYDKETNTTGFAYRDPDGNIGEAGRLDINGRRYLPILPNSLIYNEAVVLPSRLGPAMTDVELVMEIYAFINRYYDIESFFGRLAAFYVLFTWVYDCFRGLPYLRALGDWGGGKTEFIWRVGHVCYRPMKMSGAASSSAMFRVIHWFKGTLLLDEADLNQSDAASDVVKILNTGNQKGKPVWRVKETGDGSLEPEAFDVYGPKLIAMREPFQDQATESRCLTLQVRRRSTAELVKKKIPIEVGREFYEEALQLRNKLLRWRMERWQPEIELDNADIDVRVEPRLNQVTMALKRLVKDEAMREEIEQFIRAYNDRLILDRQMTLEAKVLEAIIKIHETGGVVTLSGHLEIDLSIANVARVANLIMDEENKVDEDDEDAAAEDDRPFKKKDGKQLTPRGVGHLIDKKLGLERERITSGANKGRFAVVWDEERIQALRDTYGL